MRAAVLFPFFAATQCLELALVFLVVHLKLSRRPENLTFCLLAFFLSGMTGCELLVQETDSLTQGLFWYRLQLSCALCASVLIIHFLALVAGQAPLRRVWSRLLYPLTALLAAGAWHPLVLHLPPPHTRPTDLDTEATGLLFYPYVGLPLIALTLACFLGLRGLKRRRSRADTGGDFLPLFRGIEWIAAGLALIVLAAGLEILELVLPPKIGDYLPINPRAVAVTIFCLITACILGREVLLNEQRKRRLDVENRTRLQAVRDVQHEVGNKLAGIRTPLLVARLGLEQGREAIHSAARIADALAEVSELETLIRRMLNAARMEAGLPPELEPRQPTDVLALAQSLCDKKTRLLAQEREAHLLRGGSGDALPRHRLHLTAHLAHARAPAHADTLARILDNLLDNAVKYSPNGGDIRVHLQEGDGALAITVSDPGLGIAPDDQARIFDEPFHRGRAPRAISGTGLGLNLVKRLLEAQGGRIAVRSAPGRGSAFTLTLPWSPDEAGA